MKASDLVVGRGVQILYGPYAGQTGEIVNFRSPWDPIEVEISGTKKVIQYDIHHLKLIDPFNTIYRRFENQNINKNMKKFVAESIDEMMENRENQKPKNALSEKEKMEKTDAVKINQGKQDKANQAIDALKKKLADAKKPGAFSTLSEKNATIKELEQKIAAWEAKLK